MGDARQMTDLIGQNRIKFGPYEADLHTHELWKFGTRVKLVGQPFAILSVLLTKPGELVTREELRERLWPGETFVDFNHGLNAAMNKLRDVLCDSAEDPKFIETLPRRGYRFVAKVERPEPEKEMIAPEPVVAEPKFEPVVEKEERPVTSVRRRVWPFWVAGAVVAAVLLLAVFLSILKIAGGYRAQIEQQGAMQTSPLKGAQRVLLTGKKNEGPQLSPDGKRIVFMSDRGGEGKDLWIADASGVEPKQLTYLRSAGSPKWSPDGSKVAFDTQVNGRTSVMVVNAGGGTPSFVVADRANNSVPNWSRDGKWIYFASDRTGEFEVWKVPAEGGVPQRLTNQGGFAAYEAADGTVYYAKSQFPQPEIWRLKDGGEAPVWPKIRPGTWASWGLSSAGILYIEEGPGNVAMLSELELPSQRMRQITVLGRFPFWMGVSSDGKKIVFDRADSEETTSVVELEDFR